MKNYDALSNALSFEFEILLPEGITMGDITKFMETDDKWINCMRSPYDSDKWIPVTQYTGPYTTDNFIIKHENIVGYFEKIVDNKLVIYTSKDLWENSLVGKFLNRGIKLYAYPKAMISTIDDNYVTTIHNLLSFDIWPSD